MSNKAGITLYICDLDPDGGDPVMRILTVPSSMPQHELDEMMDHQGYRESPIEAIDEASEILEQMYKQMVKGLSSLRIKYTNKLN